MPDSEQITMAHGSGGRAMAGLIQKLFFKYFKHDLPRGNDFTPFSVPGGKMVMSTDSFVISPLFFPGGDIGQLAVHGTVNDIAMSGATPLYLSASFIMEEGLELETLEKIVISMALASEKAKVPIITGDTKVVEKGKGDGLFINTTGIGILPGHLNISGENARPGDAIIISGTIGDHGMSILSTRENLTFKSQIKSDAASLNHLIKKMVDSFPGIRCLRDPTRGGVAATLNEIAEQSQVGMRIFEDKLPINGQVNSLCEILGLDPLNVANEGKLICICPQPVANELLELMRSFSLGENSEIIGEVLDSSPRVVLKTSLGGERFISWPEFEQLPRIC